MYVHMYVKKVFSFIALLSKSSSFSLFIKCRIFLFFNALALAFVDVNISGHFAVTLPKRRKRRKHRKDGVFYFYLLEKNRFLSELVLYRFLLFVKQKSNEESDWFLFYYCSCRLFLFLLVLKPQN